MELYKIGSTGEMVKRIQRVIHCLDDGIFGRLTEEAVKEWQKENGLTPDGIVGPKTLAKMFPAIAGLKKSKRKITDIVIHCTATPEGRDYTVDQIRKDHKAQGWSDIGYHYVIYRDGTRCVGRDVDISGAHVENHNSHSIGIAYVGGLENKAGVPYAKLKAKDTRTEEQKVALLSLLLELKSLYPNAKITGHRDWTNKKDCPSFDAKAEYRII